MDENRKHIEDYVYYGSRRSGTPKLLAQAVFAVFFFTFWGFLMGWLLKGPALMVSWLMVAVALAYTPIAFWLAVQDQSRYLERFLIAAITGTFFSITFLLFAVQWTFLLPDNLFYLIYLPAGFIAVLTIDFMIVCRRIKKGVYANKIGNTENLGPAAASGSVLGGAIAKLFTSVDQNTLIPIAVVLIFLIAMLLAHGITNYLKVYYIMKYDLKDPGESKENQR